MGYCSEPRNQGTFKPLSRKLLEKLLIAEAEFEAASTPAEQEAARLRWLAAAQRIGDFLRDRTTPRSGKINRTE